MDTERPDIIADPMDPTNNPGMAKAKRRRRIPSSKIP